MNIPADQARRMMYIVETVMSYQFKAHVIIRGQITCLTGLHVGGTEEGYEIGGMDNPILRDKVTGYPYIPGSSIKGKMRSMMEWVLGKVSKTGAVHVCPDPMCKVCRIFGTSADRWGKEGGKEKGEIGPTRLTIRDAHLSQETREDPRYVRGGIFTTEIKTENSLNRITSAANPRPMERVPKGAKFDFEMLYGIYDIGDAGATDIENLEQLSMALQMLEASVLGGGGSRGSGQIAIESPRAEIRTLEDYSTKASGEEIQRPVITADSVSELMANVQQTFKASQS
jgi:CRISPR-associated protein Csm3